MKKLSKVLFASLLALSLLVACGGGGNASGGKVKLGVASTQKVDVKDEKAAFDTVVVGVALVEDKVAYIAIDQSQQEAELKDGKAVIEAAKTKKEKGADYGMLDASKDAGLGKEWDEQIAALEEALVGKTKDEITTYMGSEDVKTAATIHLGDIQETVLKAIDSAVEVEGVAKVGLGYSVAVDSKGEGLKPESVLEYAMVAVDADGKIVKALLDNAQEKAEVEGGALVAKNIGKTKGELKDAYGMKGASPIEKEWNEQNDALMEALVGKTLAEAYELKAGEGDIESSVTIHIDGVQAALKNAEAALKDVK